MKKGLAFFLALAVSISVFTGCKKSKSKETPGETLAFEPVLDTQKELSLNIIGIYGNFEALEQVITDFNEFYPNVSITYEYATGLEKSTVNRCAVKDNIDIVFLYTNEIFTYYGTLADQYLVDLQQIDINLSNFEKHALENTKRNGKLSFLPVYYQSTGILVNTTILEKNGISIPKNRTEFEAACDKLLSKGITPIFSMDNMFGNLWFNHTIFEIMKSPKRDEIIADLNNGIFHPEILDDSIAMYNEWNDKGYFDFSGNELTNTYDALIMRFLEGDIPFTIAMSDTISGMKKREARSKSFGSKPFKYTYIPSPTANDGYEEVLLPSLLFSVCNVSENLDYANEFMRYLTTDKGMTTLVTVKGMPSPYNKTGDYRISYFENLRDNETYYLGDNNLSRKATNGLFYSFAEWKLNSDLYECTESKFVKFTTKKRKEK